MMVRLKLRDILDDGSSDVIVPEVVEGKIVTSISDACFL